MFEKAKQKLQKEDAQLQHTLSLEEQSDCDNQLNKNVW